MNYQGNLLKMSSEFKTPVAYYLNFNDSPVLVNGWLGKTLHFHFTGQINCIHCGRVTSKSFSQGFCYPCFTTLPQTDVGVLRPELNRAHEGVSRDMEWSKLNDLIEHYVYLSFTSDLKVGVTRITQIPTRWIDQGAEFAIKLAKTPYRQLAGLIEVALKNFVNDKTNWRKMLSGRAEEVPDLVYQKKHFSNLLPSEHRAYLLPDEEVFQISYPVEKYPVKIKSVNFDKNPDFTGLLTGIKGQYLLFDDGSVFNVRKYNGYQMNISVE
ncbi:MAG: DUF2797 domain-containing protein [Salinivirgaceae bacterium]